MLPLLLFILLHAIAAASERQGLDVIDWNRCVNNRKDMKCFVLTACKPTSKGNATSFSEASDIDAVQDRSCPFVVRVKQISSDKYLYTLHLSDAELSKTHHPSIFLYQGNSKIAGCVKESSGEVRVEGRPGTRNYTIKSIMEEGRIFCTFTLSSIKNAYAGLENKTTTVHYLRDAQAEPVVYIHTDIGIDVFEDVKPHCDSDLLKAPRNSRYRFVAEILEVSRMEISCAEENQENLGYMLYASYEDETEVEIQSVVCKGSGDPEWMIVMKNGTQTPLVPLEGETYVYCGISLSKKCTNPLCTASGDVSCPTFRPGTERENASITCAEGKWIIDDVKYNGLELKCKPDTEEDNKASFYMEDEKVTAGVCFSKYNCVEASLLSYSHCESGSTRCGVLDTGEDRMRCANGDELIVFDAQTNSTLRAKSFDCDTSTGRWVSAELNVTLPEKGAAISCPGPPPVTTVPPESSSRTDFLVLGAALAITILLFATIIPLYCYRTHRKLWKVKLLNKRKWMKKSRKKRMKTAERVFNEVMNPTPKAETHVMHGLKLIEILLRTETEEPEVWELAFQFLLKLQGVLVSYDKDISDVFAKFLYVEAKRILAKHDWICDKQIRNSNYEGYIRVVAIRLLKMSLMGKEEAKAIEMLNAGFVKLKFNAVEQYPHCGLMWAVAAQLRPGLARYPKSKERIFNQWRLLISLKFISGKKDEQFSIPEEDVIPAMGTIASQANYALGSMTKGTSIIKRTCYYMTKDSYAPFIGGLCNTVQPDPSKVIFNAMRLRPEKAQAVNEHIKKQIPEIGWKAVVKQLMQSATFRCSNLDAQKILGRFFETDKAMRASLGKMSMSSRLFEQSVAKHEKILTNWFEKRTVKTEVAVESQQSKNTSEASEHGPGSSSHGGAPPVSSYYMVEE